MGGVHAARPSFINRYLPRGECVMDKAHGDRLVPMPGREEFAAKLRARQEAAAAKAATAQTAASAAAAPVAQPPIGARATAAGAALPAAGVREAPAGARDTKGTHPAPVAPAAAAPRAQGRSEDLVAFQRQRTNKNVLTPLVEDAAPAGRSALLKRKADALVRQLEAAGVGKVMSGAERGADTVSVKVGNNVESFEPEPVAKELGRRVKESGEPDSTALRERLLKELIADIATFAK